ncbi:hypothetical protein CDAR_555781 [Caerostris darwini]|uniref:Uncharacterized protein n=1 Tax=Caerostris darwini TaxID=1538125 RepID=A0AAV4T9J9_9ARAC|nr:hypothetical protein CDAR_555781 [Caerostris darwini]
MNIALLYNDTLCHLGRKCRRFEKRNDLAVSNKTTETGVIKIYSTRTRDPLRQRKESFFRSQKRRDEFPIMLSISLEAATPACISIQTAY